VPPPPLVPNAARLLARVVANELNHVSVRVLAKHLFHAQITVAAFPEGNPGLVELLTHSVNIAHFERYVVSAANPAVAVRFRIRGLNQVELPVSQCVPSSREPERSPFYFFEPQDSSEELLRALQVLNRKRNVVKFH